MAGKAQPEPKLVFDFGPKEILRALEEERDSVSHLHTQLRMQLHSLKAEEQVILQMIRRERKPVPTAAAWGPAYQHQQSTSQPHSGTTNPPTTHVDASDASAPLSYSHTLPGSLPVTSLQDVNPRSLATSSIPGFGMQSDMGS